jgi:hypothetical protein
MMRPSRNGGCRIDRLLEQVGLQSLGQQHDDREDHRGGADHGSADEHRLGGRLEGVARAVVLFQVFLGRLEVRLEAEVLLDLLFDVGNRLDEGELVDRLRVVGDRAVGVDRDGHRAHAEEAEGDQTEREDAGASIMLLPREGHRHVVGDAHQDREHHAQPVGREVAGGEAGQDVERGATFLARP